MESKIRTEEITVKGPPLLKSGKRDRKRCFRKRGKNTMTMREKLRELPRSKKPRRSNSLTVKSPLMTHAHALPIVVLQKKIENSKGTNEEFKRPNKKSERKLLDANRLLSLLFVEKQRFRKLGKVRYREEAQCHKGLN